MCISKGWNAYLIITIDGKVGKCTYFAIQLRSKYKDVDANKEATCIPRRLTRITNFKQEKYKQ
jgi:major membrane immunogen (membrane-anchored lipoprotein)